MGTRGQATGDYRTQVEALSRLPENRVCIDCGAHHPQGVHLSFVRSVTMDKWTQEQAKRMEAGGNRNAQVFFEGYPEYKSTMTIPQKYSSEFAKHYKEKLTAAVEGRVWEKPPPSATTTATTKATVPSTTSATAVDAKTSATRSAQAVQDGQSSTGVAVKERNEQYFAQKGAENQTRPTGIEPSQGGRFSGFGNPNFATGTGQSSRGSGSSSAFEEAMLEDPLKMLSKGWSMFTAYAAEGVKIAAEQAEEVGKQVNERVIRPTAEVIRETELDRTVGGYYQVITSKVVEVGNSGMKIANEYLGSGGSGYDGRSGYDSVDEKLKWEEKEEEEQEEEEEKWEEF